ncbi:hypothetical protein MKW92_009455, partial [Papaver armeniacum]
NEKGSSTDQTNLPRHTDEQCSDTNPVNLQHHGEGSQAINSTSCKSPRFTRQAQHRGSVHTQIVV